MTTFVEVVSESAVDSMGVCSGAVDVGSKRKVCLGSMFASMAVSMCEAVLMSVRGDRLARCSEGEGSDGDGDGNDSERDVEVLQEWEEYELSRLRVNGYVLDIVSVVKFASAV